MNVRHMQVSQEGHEGLVEQPNAEAKRRRQEVTATQTTGLVSPMNILQTPVPL